MQQIFTTKSNLLKYNKLQIAQYSSPVCEFISLTSSKSSFVCYVNFLILTT